MEGNILKDAISKYLERGFGSMNKNDFEVWIFHYLTTHQLQGKTNYEISIELRMPETKVKRLRYEAELKYAEAKPLDNYHRICKLLQNVRFKKDGNSIQFTIEDLYLRKYLDSVLKTGGRFSDSSFNSEIVSMNYDDLEFFLTSVPEEKKQLENLLKEARQKKKDEKLTFKYLLGTFCESMAQEFGKKTADVSIAGLCSFVASWI